MNALALARREASSIDCDLADAGRYRAHRRTHLLDAQGRLSALSRFIQEALDEGPSDAAVSSLTLQLKDEGGNSPSVARVDMTPPSGASDGLRKSEGEG